MTDTGGDGGGAGLAIEVMPPTTDIEQSKSPRAQAYNELYNLAGKITETRMVPKEFRGRRDEAFAVMVYGAELGLDPMDALQSIHIIDGRPTCSASLMRGLIQGAGHLFAWREVTDDRVELYARRRDTGAACTVAWTIDDAKRAKLFGKGNWSTYPRAMLCARATSEMARLMFADVLHGIAYTPEEAGAVGPYAAIDIDYDPRIDHDTGEIIDDTGDDMDIEPDEEGP